MYSADAAKPHRDELMSKVPQVTIAFWVIKILATTVGETGGDALSMTLKLGYLVSTFIFLAIFAVTLSIQVRTNRYHPFAYWAVVVATTTVGTTTSDFLDRTVGLGYVLSSVILLSGVVGILLAWKAVVGKVEFEHITTKKEEIFYWSTIVVSNTLGTALGDFFATTAGLGFERGAILFTILLAIVAAVHYFSKKVPTALLFWSAYILTRPLGATLGDTLTKPYADGGLALGRISSSLTIGAAMVIGIVMLSLWHRRQSKPL